jgi:hypothetical protein
LEKGAAQLPAVQKQLTFQVFDLIRHGADCRNLAQRLRTGNSGFTAKEDGCLEKVAGTTNILPVAENDGLRALDADD